MKVTTKASCMVKPAEPTWSGRVALSELDQIGNTTHTAGIYFYTKPSDEWNVVLQFLKTSLATTLVHFYPLAGRLVSITGGRLELNCNTDGVHFTEAYADVKLDDVEYPTFAKFVPSIDDLHTPLEEIPLVCLQVTRFVCGGWTLGTLMSHVAVDGQSVFHFLSEWARACRGEPMVQPPYLDRKVLRAGDPATTMLPCLNKSVEQLAPFGPPPSLLGQMSNRNERTQETTKTMLKLTETFVEKLRNEANKNRKPETERGFSRYEVVTAHIWRTTCKARNLEPEQITVLWVSVDVRRRMNPPLPEKYSGNAIFDVIATGTSGEIVSETLGYVSTKIRDTIEKVDSEFVNSYIDFLKNQQELSKLQSKEDDDEDDQPFYGNPNLGVVSWLTLPLKGLDFGWGNETFWDPRTCLDNNDGDFAILHGEEGSGSLVVALCLQVRHLEDFKRVFYQSIEQDVVHVQRRSKY